VLAWARDRNGKPAMGWACAQRGLVMDSPVPLRLAWQAPKHLLHLNQCLFDIVPEAGDDAGHLQIHPIFTLN
jgi:hypothetical protein